MKKIAARKIPSDNRSIFAHVCRAVAFGVGGSIFALAQTAGAQSPPDDTARFLAGMPLPKNSPLAPLTTDAAWQEHSANFERAFAKLNTRQLQKLHIWEGQYFPESREHIPVAFYMFSGPDFLYVDQFF